MVTLRPPTLIARKNAINLGMATKKCRDCNGGNERTVQCDCGIALQDNEETSNRTESARRKFQNGKQTEHWRSHSGQWASRKVVFDKVEVAAPIENFVDARLKKKNS